MTFSCFEKYSIAQYKNSLNIKEYFDSNNLFFQDNDYIVIWYGGFYNASTRQNSQKLVKVFFLNLTYLDRTFITTLQVPMDYVIKLPIGSIWKNGKSQNTLDFPVKNIELHQEDESYSIQSFSQIANRYKEKSDIDLNNLFPFELQNYPIPNPKYDGNKLISFKHNGQRFILHPLIFFNAHYGYSMEVKRILLTYLWGNINNTHDHNRREVIDKLFLNYKNSQNRHSNLIYLPARAVNRDAIFLHHLKTDIKTQNVVKHLNSEARLAFSESKSKAFYPVIQPWHDQSINMNVKGIELTENNFLCTQITAISEPKGSPITIMMRPRYSQEGTLIQDVGSHVSMPLHRKEGLEEIQANKDLCVNNLHVACIKESLKILGEQRELLKNQNELQANATPSKLTITSPEATSYATGEQFGDQGKTGWIQSVFSDFHDIPMSSRLTTVWEHAKELKNLPTFKGAKAHWFTFNNMFSDDDKFRTMSMFNCHERASGTNYPNEVLVVKIEWNSKVFFVLDFQPESGKSVSGIAVKLNCSIKSFLDPNNEEGLLNLIIKIALFNGRLSYDFIDSYQGNISTFKHSNGKQSNWISNVLNRLIS